MSATNPTAIITEQVDKITGGGDVTETILHIAEYVDFNWFEWAIKVGIVTVAFLIGKNIVYNIYYYLRLRFDDHIGIGAIVKFNGSVIGRIQACTLTTIIIETVDGYVRIPLSVWNSTYWTQLKTADTIDFKRLKKQKEVVELKLEQERADNKAMNARLVALEELASAAKSAPVPEVVPEDNKE